MKMLSLGLVIVFLAAGFVINAAIDAVLDNWGVDPW